MQTSKNRTFSNPRVVVLLVGALAILGLFVLRLWDVQIVHGADFRAQADQNRFRLDSIDAPRGIIYDRNGQPLVHNAPSFEVQIVPAYLPDSTEAEMKIYQRLAALLDMPVEAPVVKTAEAMPMGHGAMSLVDMMSFLSARLNERLDALRTPGVKDLVDQVSGVAPYSPVTIKAGVDRSVALQIAEETNQLPGVRVHAASSRQYISGTLLSGIVGYMRRISPDDLSSLPADVYDPNTDRIGAVGIEGQFEDQLRGQKGKRYVEEDVVGREIRVVGEADPAVSGDNIYLTLDFDLQKVAQQALQGEIDYLNRYAGRIVTQRGVVIAMNPKTGEILAMVSLPSYDNNVFSQPVITPDQLKALSDNPYLPQVNHAFQSAFPPGSTFKIVPAAGALQEGVLTSRTTLFDPGIIVIPNQYFPDDPRQAQKFYNWNLNGFGNQNVVQALAHSDDVFFYKVAGGYHVPNEPEFNGLNIDRMDKYAELFGFGSPTGIDLVGESPGFVPDPVWKRRTYGENWSLGDTYNFGIGQGYFTATPLQVVNAMAAIANGGTLMKPHIVAKITDADGNVIQSFGAQGIRKIPVDFANIQIVQQGVIAAVNWPDGTAIKAQVPGVTVAGKTGTAEYCDDLSQKNGDCYPGHTPSHAWFTAYAPADNPQIAVVVFIYNGGEGSQVAAPVAQQILQYWFEQHSQQKAGTSP
jgi:penicillin-binding protein 2